ncbi:MAG: hypothetical protein ABSD31_01275 [Candidatus Binataceae bacterium]
MELLVNKAAANFLPVIRGLNVMVDQLTGSRFEGLCSPPYSIAEVYVFTSRLAPLFRDLAALERHRIEGRTKARADSGTRRMDEIQSEEILAFNFPLFCGIAVDGTGHLRISRPPSSICHYLAQQLQGALEGEKASRIRICLKCENLFRAKRANQKFCKRSCTDSWWQRRWYRDHLEDARADARERASRKRAGAKINERPRTRNIRRKAKVSRRRASRENVQVQ